MEQRQMEAISKSRRFGLSVFLVAFPVIGGAQEYSAEYSWPVDPTLPGHVVHAPPSPDFRHYEIDVLNPVDGSTDAIAFDKATGNWLAFGEDGIVVGGKAAPGDVAPPSTQCAGPALILCIGGGVALICEIRRNLAVQRAQQQCAAQGRGLEIRSQTGCGDVKTRCTVVRSPSVQIQ